MYLDDEILVGTWILAWSCSKLKKTANACSSIPSVSLGLIMSRQACACGYYGCYVFVHGLRKHGMVYMCGACECRVSCLDQCNSGACECRVSCLNQCNSCNV